MDPLDLAECVAIILGLTNTNPAVIIIDGLDECDPVRRHELISTFETVTQNSLSLVKVLISSQDDGDIVARLSGHQNVHLVVGDTLEDMEQFIELEVSRSITQKRLLRNRVTVELKAKIIAFLQRRAQGS